MEGNNDGSNDGSTNIDYEINQKIKLFRELLKTAKNPVIIKILKTDLKSYLACKHLIDMGKRK